MNRNTSRIVMCIAAATVAVTATTGAASYSPTAPLTRAPHTQAPHTQAPVAVAVHALVTRSADAATRAIPADFASVMGYRPMTTGDMAENPHGDCSSPVPLPSEFEAACKQHDLGYDLIRYAARTGNAVDPQWRRAIDGQLERRMHAACTERREDGPRRACEAAASVAAAAVDMNSWRQSFGAPVAEPALPIALGGAVFAVMMLSISLTVRYLRRPRVTVAGIGELA
ncbi:hypothetical protein ACIGGF_09570 [Rhodococcus sp. NPDC078407]|uniref:hypothetical protein n=1 Tax=Rhodococcus sp. NPDC078407 TaxID=3364509 RepID=UPI0037C527CB